MDQIPNDENNNELLHPILDQQVRNDQTQIQPEQPKEIIKPMFVASDGTLFNSAQEVIEYQKGLNNAEIKKKESEAKAQNLTTEQIEKLSKIPPSVLEALKEDPKRWKYIESMTALNKIKDLSVDIKKQMRFIPRSSNIGVMVLRKDDGSQIIDSFRPFVFVRDPKNRVAQAVFTSPKPKTKWMTKLPIIGGMGFLYERTERVFNTELAIPSLYGWMSAFDAGTLEQTPLTNDKNLIPLYHKIDRELNQTIQGLILANTEAERLKKRGSFWEKYGVNIMLFIAIIILALAIYQNASNLAGLQTQIGNLGSQISNLGGLLPKVTGGLPAT